MNLPRSVHNAAIALTAVLLVAACDRQSSMEREPETVLFNGRIFTGTASVSFAEAVLVRGSRIAAVGSTQEVTAKAVSDARRIDLMGRLVIPGINDAHLHMDLFLPEHTPLPFENMDPPCSVVLDRVRDAVRNAPKEMAIIGAIGQTAFFEEDCIAQTLDRLAPAHAVVLHTWTPHAAILNRSAVKMFSVPTSGPPEGGFYGKDGRSTKWDGVIREYAFFEFWAGLSRLVKDDQARQSLKPVLGEAVRLGITSLQAMSADPERLVRLLQELDTPVRVRAMWFPVTGVLHAKPHPRKQISDRIAYGDLKVILDGTPIERSAAMRTPHDDAADSRGELNFTPEQIRGFLRGSREGGYQLMLHAVGDRGVEAVIEALEADGSPGWPERRVRLEHGDGVFPDLARRARRLGVGVVQNPSHLMLPDLILKRYGVERAKVDMPLRSLVAMGLPLALGSDGPLNPFLNLMFAVTYPSKPAEALTREQALRAYTQGSAYSEFADHEKGTLEAGKLADLAVLSQNIFEVPLQALPATDAVLTMVGGMIIRDSR
jgi:predicted amidohydrolase YtcJ